MEDLKDIIAPLKNIECESELFYDLVHLICLDIRKKYIMIAPTPSNIDFINNIEMLKSTSMPNLTIINKVDKEIRRSFVLSQIILESFRYHKNDWFENIVETVTNNYVVIKKDQYFEEYKFVMKLTRDLTGESEIDNIRQIQFLTNTKFHKNSTHLTDFFSKLLNEYNQKIVKCRFLEFYDDIVSFHIHAQENVNLDSEILKEDYKTIRKVVNKTKTEFKSILKSYPLFISNDKKPNCGGGSYYSSPEVWYELNKDQGKWLTEINNNSSLREIRDRRERLSKSGLYLNLPTVNTPRGHSIRFSIKIKCSFEDFKSHILNSFTKS